MQQELMIFTYSQMYRKLIWMMIGIWLISYESYYLNWLLVTSSLVEFIGLFLGRHVVGCSLNAFELMVFEIVNSLNLDCLVHLLGCVVDLVKLVVHFVDHVVHDLNFDHSSVSFLDDLEESADLTLGYSSAGQKYSSWTNSMLPNFELKCVLAMVSRTVTVYSKNAWQKIDTKWRNWHNYDMLTWDRLRKPEIKC